MQELLRMVGEDRDVQAILAGLRSGMREQLLSGLAGSAKQVVMAALARELERPLVVLAHNLFACQKIAEDLSALLAPDEVLLYPANELIAAEGAVASPEMLAQRVDVLTRLAGGFRGVVVVPAAGMRRFLPDPKAFREATMSVRRGDALPMESFVRRLTELGYERVEQVERKGEFAVRGGIVDVFPLTADLPCRLEWFDDEIDSVRVFDPAGQRSLEATDSVRITPCTEIVVTDPRRWRSAAEHAQALLDEQLAKMSDRTARQRLAAGIGADVDRLRAGEPFAELYRYVPLLYPERKTMADFFPEDAVLVVDDPMRIAETLRQLDRDEAEWQTARLSEGKALPSVALSKPADAVLYRPRFQTVYFSLFLRQIPHVHPQNVVNVACRAMQHFHGQMNVLKSEMERWRKNGMRVFVVADGEERLQRVRRVLADYGIDEPTWVSGNLQAGFELPSVRLAVVTESELFARRQRKQPRRATAKIDNAERIRSYTELKPGDYVVHVHHGIGKFIGIGTLLIGGVHRDYLHILYANGDKLSVPVDQVGMIQKYVSGDDKEPKLSRLGGGDWARVKNKVRSSVRQIADDLVRLYAERQAVRGFAFSKDTEFHREFDSLFPYEETPDQLRAIEEVKRDMEQPRPMDRLLCGDVGYGKTEVAIRAAFKAVYDGKQVAVLVPTTILAQQHYATFRDRFSGFPVEIRVLSRFRSRKEQKETIEGLKNGTVDIVIGTHRLLSKDVVFKDLGLLIVDEEQRFGVTHKEKLKLMRTNVDVLTLTATPIPRTLHMSMLGVRDLSVIETPPENRFPVQTFVVEYSPSLVREAIERELAREGQVYYVYNRVQGIHRIAEHLSSLVPDARIAVAHGQMPEQELERTILDFLEGEYDVLVSTSIIETGIDIPNVNTLIVHDADKLGLAQLYQLRGRIGRSSRIAYAYFTYQPDKVLSETAEKRLQAIREFTELGSGFKIAMRDLAIRGAGNLLGAEQHGFIAHVGFDLYTQMLAEEIRKRKAELTGEPPEPEPLPQAQIDLQVDAYLPSEYVADGAHKIEIYKKAAAARRIEDVDDLLEEMTDRFGDPPESALRLLAVARLRVLCTEIGVESVAQKGDAVTLTFHERASELVDPTALAKTVSAFGRAVELSPGPPPKLTFRKLPEASDKVLATIERFLLQYKEAAETKGEMVHHAAP